MTATILYEGNLRCVSTHLQSNSIIETDAPTDNRGKGKRFSPTDLLCTSLVTCMITTMAIKASDMGIELKGTSAEMKKHMLSDPRRIGMLDVTIHFDSALQLSEKDRIILERTAHHCPVGKSLHPDVKLNITFI